MIKYKIKQFNNPFPREEVLNNETNTWLNKNSNSQEYQEYLQWLSDGNIPDIEEPIVDYRIAERMALENKYLLASKQLCQLAGDIIEDGVYPKLEDADFESKAILAIAADGKQANYIINSMTYYLLQLKFAYNWSWEKIEYRNI